LRRRNFGKSGIVVISFGGFLGLAHKHYPVPWNVLTYDKSLDGRVVACWRGAFHQLRVASDDDPDTGSRTLLDTIRFVTTQV
jgi:hypothetical protein